MYSVFDVFKLVITFPKGFKNVFWNKISNNITIVR